MTLAIVLLILLVAIKGFVYYRISVLNKSYMNSYTAGFGSFLLIQYLPFMLTLSRHDERMDAVQLLAIILITGEVFFFFGYFCGHRIRLPERLIPAQKKAINRYDNYLFYSLVCMVVSFLILSGRSLGLREWLFNNRNAYITGRAGNGIWYILFELFLIISAVLVLCIADSKKNKTVLKWYLIPVIASYFTGSKGIMLEMAIVFLVNYDLFFYKIRFRKIVIAGLLGFLAVIVLLKIQSNATLIEYADYYTQFVRFLEYKLSGKWQNTYGQLWAENIFWNLIPRQFYHDKPYIYGAIRIVNIFFGEEYIISGNTPSFTEYAVPYADFDIIGVAVMFFCNGLFNGFFECNLRKHLDNKGINFNAMFLYVILFFARPVSFSNLYLLIFFVFLVIAQAIRVHFVGGRKKHLMTTNI